MSTIRFVCVYCGSSVGNDARYREAAEGLGRSLGKAGLGLVYGGGGHGLMGVVARATLASGGPVVGIIPDFLVRREGSDIEITEKVIVPDMHTRKRLMFERADAFVALPGGIGTLEELVEMMTWAQLGRHGKPILVADVDGFWSPFLDLLDHMVAKGYLGQDVAERTLVARDIDDVIPMLRAAAAPTVAEPVMALDKF